MRPYHLVLLVTALAWTATGCTTGGRLQPQTAAPTSLPPRGESARTLTMAFRFEATDLSSKIVKPGNGGTTEPLFNAALAVVDNARVASPYLAEALPQLNTDSWRVLGDGRMETTYRLRPNLTWHDGSPLTAEDFVFAWRVYTAPGIGVFYPKPQDQIDEVVAPDPRTVFIRWGSPYPEAGALNLAKLDPLPAIFSWSTSVRSSRIRRREMPF